MPAITAAMMATITTATTARITSSTMPMPNMVWWLVV
jgi:hypothetical protein